MTVDEAKSFDIADTSGIGSYEFCVSGDGMVELREQELLSTFLHHISVFARVSPGQKEEVIVAFKEAGDIVLMCGDGTNDVGALKQAHVGVALLNNPPKEKAVEGNATGAVTAPTVSSTSKRKQPSRKAVAKASAPAAPGQPRQPVKRVRKKPTIGPPSIVDDEELKLVQLGDASIASPFTAKGQSVVPILHIIRQGRCTLVTTLQMFMILALNCLISAYSMSVLYLEGFKMGDTYASPA